MPQVLMEFLRKPGIELLRAYSMFGKEKSLIQHWLVNVLLTTLTFTHSLLFFTPRSTVGLLLTAMPCQSVSPLSVIISLKPISFSLYMPHTINCSKYLCTNQLILYSLSLAIAPKPAPYLPPQSVSPGMTLKFVGIVEVSTEVQNDFSHRNKVIGSSNDDSRVVKTTNWLELNNQLIRNKLETSFLILVFK